MKRKIIGMIFFMLMISSVVFMPVPGFVINDTISKPLLYRGTLYVGGSGPGNYTRIQDAINDATDGDTVFVYDDSSPYFENIIIDKSINLIGEQKDTTVINGNDSKIVVNIVANNVMVHYFTIENFNIQYNKSNHLINIESDYNFIFENILTGNKTSGIHVYESLYNNISNNIIISKDLSYGMDLENCDYTTICGNKISVDGAGIYVRDSSNNEIIGNTITDSYHGISLGLITIDSYIYGNILTNNTMSGIFIYGFSSNTTIIQNDISYNGEMGVLIFISINNKIIQNNFIGNKKKNAFFIYPIRWILPICKLIGIKLFFPRIYWDGNYWDEPRLQPYFIFGNVCFTEGLWAMFDLFLINWINLDRNPAKEPYDIG